MVNKKNHITIFEHQSLKVGKWYNSVEFKGSHLKRFERFFGDKGVPFFSLINKGVRFKEYVGVLQIGDLTVEVLPKADKHPNNEEGENEWRKILIDMMRSVGAFNIKAPSSSSLNIKTNFILDLYFELFIKEMEYLFNKGLIKKYRKTESNTFALKGNILFGKHIQQNLVHQERIYVRHTTFDKEHILHQILYKTLQLLAQINTNIVLKSRIGNLLLNFPEIRNIKILEPTFNKIVYNRKTEEYKNAIAISRLLLLNYHPDLSKGQNNVLALMFDMNMLWEKFIYVSLRKNIPDEFTITAQTSKNFWQPDNSNKSSKLRPDIVIKNRNKTFVIDTKWKNLGNHNPSSDDLRQLYVYHKYYIAEKVALVYPGNWKINKGKYFEPNDDDKISKDECRVIPIPIDGEIRISDWQVIIKDQIFENWIEEKETPLKTN